MRQNPMKISSKRMFSRKVGLQTLDNRQTTHFQTSLHTVTLTKDQVINEDNIFRPYTANINNKNVLTQSLKKHQFYRKILNNSINNPMNKQELTVFRTKLDQAHHNNANGNLKSHILKEIQKHEIARNYYEKDMLACEIPLEISLKAKNQDSRIKSFENFIESKRRSDVKKNKFHDLRPCLLKINIDFQITGNKKSIELKDTLNLQKEKEKEKCKEIEIQQPNQFVSEKKITEQNPQNTKLNTSIEGIPISLSQIKNCSYLKIDKHPKKQSNTIIFQDYNLRYITKANSKIDYNSNQPKKSFRIDNTPLKSNRVNYQLNLHQTQARKEYINNKSVKKHYTINDIQGWKINTQNEQDFLTPSLNN